MKLSKYICLTITAHVSDEKRIRQARIIDQIHTLYVRRSSRDGALVKAYLSAPEDL